MNASFVYVCAERGYQHWGKHGNKVGLIENINIKDRVRKVGGMMIRQREKKRWLRVQ
jgi:sporulation protein YlmC with PRC-barrel domain